MSTESDLLFATARSVMARVKGVSEAHAATLCRTLSATEREGIVHAWQRLVEGVDRLLAQAAKADIEATRTEAAAEAAAAQNDVGPS